MKSENCQIEKKHLLHPGYHHPVLRALQSNIQVNSNNLMFPVFVCDDADGWQDIPAMPDQKRVGINRLKQYLQPSIDNGLKSVILFGVYSSTSGVLKDERGSLADDENGPIIRSIKLLKKEFPGLLVACDVCLCAYTSHGHCGIFTSSTATDTNRGGDGDDTSNNPTLNNEESIKRLASVACAYGRAGADIVAPSDMMDGRVFAIKQALIEQKLYQRVSVMSYSAKFASSFYGPFRHAANSDPSFGDRKCYQLPPGARGLAKRAIMRDVEEGADIIMVKPGYPYLDIVVDAKTLCNHPVAVYQVSGEYSMLYHAAITHNLMDLRNGVMESVESYIRAGATLIVTYWTPKVLEWLKQSSE